MAHARLPYGCWPQLQCPAQSVCVWGRSPELLSCGALLVDQIVTEGVSERLGEGGGAGLCGLLNGTLVSGPSLTLIPPSSLLWTCGSGDGFES